MSHRLLVEEPFVAVSPSLATAIGLNEAIFVQTLHFWLTSPHGRSEGGCRWIYNTVDQWHEQLPFWSPATIKRIIAKLKKQGILRVEKLDQSKWDHTNWYSLDYEKIPLNNPPPPDGTKSSDGTDQIDPIDKVNVIPSTYTNITYKEGAPPPGETDDPNIEEKPMPKVNDVLAEKSWKKNKPLPKTAKHRLVNHWVDCYVEAYPDEITAKPKGKEMGQIDHLLTRVGEDAAMQLIANAVENWDELAYYVKSNYQKNLPKKPTIGTLLVWVDLIIEWHEQDKSDSSDEDQDDSAGGVSVPEW